MIPVKAKLEYQKRLQESSWKEKNTMKLIITLIHEDEIISIMNDISLHILGIKKINNNNRNNPCQELNLRRNLRQWAFAGLFQ